MTALARALQAAKSAYVAREAVTDLTGAVTYGYRVHWPGESGVLHELRRDADDALRVVQFGLAVAALDIEEWDEVWRELVWKGGWIRDENSVDAASTPQPAGLAATPCA